MYTLLITGDVPGAASYFNPLLQQTIIPCTSGTRPSSPAEGWHVYETDTNRLAKYTGSAWEYVAGSRESFTPTLSASTPPTMGTGNARNGWFAYGPGPTITYTWHILFGSSGVAAGSGNYTISLPVSPAAPYGTGNTAVGTILLADSSSGGFRVGTPFISSGGTTLGAIVENSVIVGSANPWTWAAGDYLSGCISYPV